MVKIGTSTILNIDCVEYMQSLPDKFFDLTVTSPPYDKLRTYNGSNDEWCEDKWKSVISCLYSVTKDSGVVVWIVGDQTINGSETGTSFKQALYAKDCGFNLHDTMIYRKKNYTPLTHNRYEQEFEYIFIFTKGKKFTFSPIKVPCKYAGTSTWGEPNMYKDNSGNLTRVKKTIINNEKIKGNIHEYIVGSTQTGKIKHPAMFPLELAQDQIFSWSNENDLVFDPFMGSGTSAIACANLKRKFIGTEIDDQYYALARERIEYHAKQQRLF